MAGNLACQRQSYLKELEATVVSVEEQSGASSGTAHVIFNDTVIFPEGGGQPSDAGWINERFAITSCFRRGTQAVHVVQMSPVGTHASSQPSDASSSSSTVSGGSGDGTESFASVVTVGARVTLTVDWERRWDHMQQHSAQHLITAVALNVYGLKTTSWSLGATKSNLELASTSITGQMLADIEARVNDAIRESKAVSTQTYLPNSPELAEVRSRGLPEDVLASGSLIRVVSIGEMDLNTCCGTHISTTSHLQMVKLLHTEQTRGCTRVFFVAGSRTLKLLDALYQDSRALAKQFSCAQEEVVERVDGLQRTVKVLNKQVKSLLKRVGEADAEKLKSQAEELLKSNAAGSIPLIVHHRDDADADYLGIVAAPLAALPVVAFLSIIPVQESSTPSFEGQFLIVGASEMLVSAAGKLATELLGGKGGGKKGRFQGNAKSLTPASREKVGNGLRELLSQQK